MSLEFEANVLNWESCLRIRQRQIRCHIAGCLKYCTVCNCIKSVFGKVKVNLCSSLKICQKTANRCSYFQKLQKVYSKIPSGYIFLPINFFKIDYCLSTFLSRFRFLLCLKVLTTLLYLQFYQQKLDSKKNSPATITHYTNYTLYKRRKMNCSDNYTTYI